jgi:hypothetical protein
VLAGFGPRRTSSSRRTDPALGRFSVGDRGYPGDMDATRPDRVLVGRVAGDDEGSVGTTGAEARAEQRMGESDG